MSLRLSQVQVLLQASTPFQDVEPGLDQVVSIIGSFPLPGSLLRNRPLQHALARRIVPAVEGRCLRRVKRFIDAIVIKFRLPGGELISPLLLLLAGQVRTQDRFCPGRSEVAEKSAGFAIRVVQVLPLAHVFFCNGLEDRERLATIVCFDQRPGLFDELSYLANHRPNMPVCLGRTHTIQAVNTGSHLAAYCLRIYSKRWLWGGSCWLSRDIL